MLKQLASEVAVSSNRIQIVKFPTVIHLMLTFFFLRECWFAAEEKSQYYVVHGYRVTITIYENLPPPPKTNYSIHAKYYKSLWFLILFYLQSDQLKISIEM